MTTETSLTTRTSSSLQQRCLLSIEWHYFSCMRVGVALSYTLFYHNVPNAQTSLRQLLLNASHHILSILPHCLQNLSQITLHSNTKAAIKLILTPFSNFNRFVTFYHWKAYLLQSIVDVFHLNWIVSLQYLWKLKIVFLFVNIIMLENRHRVPTRS